MFLAVLVMANTWVARLDLPDYGAWTGIRPLETKMKMLETFAASGDVDALALGSSIADFGFSAELFSQLMSRHLGRPYRVFNFATGGARPRTLPRLYRLARLVTKPRSVFVLVPPEQKLGEELRQSSPDYALLNAPVGGALTYPLFLPVSRLLWETELFSRAPAIRDLLLFGSYANLQRRIGMEAYRVSAHGDRVSYTFTLKPDLLPLTKQQNEDSVKPFPKSLARTSNAQEMLEFYFAKIDIDAMEELRDLVERDGGRIYLISHAGAAMWWGGPSSNAEYVATRQKFFQAFASKLNATFWNVVDAPVAVPLYGIADDIHLNAYGAEIFTRLAFEASLGRLDGESARRIAAPAASPPLEHLSASTQTFSPQSAILRRPAHEAHPLLRFRMVESLAVPALPQGVDLYAGLRLPDGQDIVVPAFPVGSSDFVAEVDLPPGTEPQSLVLRLMYDEMGTGKVALAYPLADYEWLRSYPSGFGARSAEPGRLQVLALPPERMPGQSLYIALKNREPGIDNLGLQLTAISGAKKGESYTLRQASQVGQLLKTFVPKQIAEGVYEVVVYDAAGGRPLGRSAPLKIWGGARPVASIVAEARPTLADGTVEVSWSGVRAATARDWVGLFPVGGGPGSRLEMVFTQGGAEGRMKFPIPPAVLTEAGAGMYEFRLYSNDNWYLLARSDPVTFKDAVLRIGK